MIDKQILQYKILSTHCKLQGTSSTRYYHKDIGKNRNKIIPDSILFKYYKEKLNNK